MRYVGLACAWLLSLVLVAVHPTVFAHPSDSPYGQFTGTWYHHGGGMFIYANGTGIDHYRTYVNCTARIVTDCDEFTKNAIYAGGFTQFRLYKVAGSTATGIVTNSPVSWMVGTKITLTRHNNDTVALRLVVGQPTNGCGPHAPAGYCGA
ncbi:MAG TPA: hypothetical protein VFA78_08400 [Chloroflexota bacterium]|nr:hypothetical protein [Chloroflexota bacterium]